MNLEERSLELEADGLLFLDDERVEDKPRGRVCVCGAGENTVQINQLDTQSPNKP
jgi:hypothetical protein